MTASFPSSVRPYVARVDLVDTVIADNVNSLQEEVKAIETALGTSATNNNPLTSTYTGTFTTTTNWLTVGDRLTNIEAGLINGVASGPYVVTTGGNTITTSSNKGLVLKVGSGTQNLFEAYSSANALGFNINASGLPLVGGSNVLYVGSTDYNTLTSGNTSAIGVANTKIPLSTVTASGDLIIGSGNATVVKLPIGSNGQSLIVSAGSVAWGTPTDTTKVPLSTFTSQGDLIVGSGSGSVTRLGVGTVGQVLTSTGSNVAWSTPTTYLGTSNAAVTAASVSSGVVRNVWVSTSAPTSSQGADGDIWVVYA